MYLLDLARAIGKDRESMNQHRFRDQYLLEEGGEWKSLERMYTKRETSRRKALGVRVWLW